MKLKKYQKKISKKSNLQKFLGGALVVVGVGTGLTYAVYDQILGLELEDGPFYLMSAGLTAVGVGLLLPPLPGYHKIGKKFIVNTSKPDTVNN